MVARTTAPMPLPTMLINGGYKYPRPAELIVIPVIFPSTITGVRSGRLNAPTPTYDSSASVSIAVSYSPLGRIVVPSTSVT